MPMISRWLFFFGLNLYLLTNVWGQDWNTLLQQGSQQYNNQQYVQAIKSLTQAKQLVEDQFGTSNLAYFAVINILSQSYQELEQYDKAQPLLENAYQLLKQNNSFDKDKIVTFATYRNLATNYYYLGDYTKAESLALEAIQNVPTVANKEDYLNLYFTTATIYYEQKQYDKANNYFQKILDQAQPNSKDYLKAQEGLAAIQYKKGLFHEAEKQYAQLLLNYEKSIGKNNQTYANMLTNAGMVVNKLQKFSQAAQLLNEAEKIYQQLNLTFSRDYALTCSWLGNTLIDLGASQEALTYLLSALKIYEKNQDIENTARTLNIIASAYEFQGDFTQAQQNYLKAIASINPNKEKLPITYGNICLNFAGLHFKLGNYKSADSLFQIALTYHQKGTQEDPLAFYESQMNYATFLVETKADYLNAQKKFETSLLFFEKSVGKNSLQYAACLVNLANIYLYLDEFKKTEQYYLQSLNILEKIVGKTNLHYCNVLNNYSNLYVRLANYEQATKLSEQSLAYAKTFMTNQAIPYATLLSNMAVSLIRIEKYENALQYLNQALEILKSHPNHPQTIATKNALAQLYFEQGSFAKAYEIFTQILPHAEKMYPEHHPILLTLINNLAVCQTELKYFSQAEENLKKLLTTVQKHYPKSHEQNQYVIYNLGYLYLKQKNFSQAHHYLKQNNQLIFQQIDKIFPYLSEKEKLGFIQEKRKQLYLFTRFASQYFNNQPSIAKELLELRLAVRGLVTDASKRMQYKAQKSKDPEIQKIYQQWLDLKNQYLKALQLPNHQQTINLNQIETQIQSSEKQLYQKLNINFKPNSINYASLLQKLQPGDVAMEVIRSVLFNEEKKRPDTLYTFLIITPQNTTHPEIVSLDAGPIERQVYEYHYRQIVNRQDVDRKSYELIWNSLVQRSNTLKNYPLNRVFLVPDGVYHKINLATLSLPNQENKFLGDNIQFIYLVHLKQLLENETSTPKKAELYGYPNYKGKPQEQPANEPSENLQINPQQRSLIARLLNFAGQEITMLPGTKVETDNIKNILQQSGITYSLYQYDEATEEQLKKTYNPDILHIATHGYIIEDLPASHEVHASSVHQLQKIQQEPLLRAGILLAHCESSFSTQALYPHTNDGILTAYEAEHLDLQNTQLVVLSACQTGLGEIRNDEGVFGLQKSFITAGSKAIIISLWPVADEPTQEFMTHFYKAWIVQKKSKADAFKYAQSLTKQKYPSPYFWGAFLLVGL